MAKKEYFAHTVHFIFILLLTADRGVPESTTIPLSEDQTGAMDYPLWRNLGSDFMVKSNINNWLACLSKGTLIVYLHDLHVVFI